MFLRDFIHKAGNPVGSGTAEEHPLPGADQMQLFLCPGQGHIAQPPLLFHFLRLADGPHSGEDALLHADNKHARKLQSLG